MAVGGGDWDGWGSSGGTLVGAAAAVLDGSAPEGWINSRTLSTSGSALRGGSGKRVRATESALSKSAALSQA